MSAAERIAWALTIAGVLAAIAAVVASIALADWRVALYVIPALIFALMFLTVGALYASRRDPVKPNPSRVEHVERFEGPA